MKTTADRPACVGCGYVAIVGQLAPIEWITGWLLHPGESGLFLCSECYAPVAADFAAIGLGPSGLAAGGR